MTLLFFMEIYEKLRLSVENEQMFDYNILYKGVGEMARTIFHVDVNSAFLSWEAAYRVHHLGGRLDLRNIPSAVGGSTEMRHGIILAKSMPAKKYKIQTGMTVIEAQRNCPDLYLVPPNYSLYQRCSEAFLKVLREYTPDVEVYSIDEAFLDMSETLHLYGSAVECADQIRNRIKEELGFTVNIGISDNKLLAKMAGDLIKPDRTITLYPDEIKEKMWPLPVSDLFFCGRASAKKLHSLGIETIGELAAADPEILKKHMKKQGQVLWAFANGYDNSSVVSDPPPQKGYGNSTTTPFDVTDAGTAKKVLLGLSETVAARLRKHHMKAGLISVGIRNFQLQHAGHQMVLDTPTNITIEIYHTACRLFDEAWNPPIPIRQLGIHTGRLYDSDCPRQASLFDRTDYERLERLDAYVDQIRGRYGNDSLIRAIFLEKDGPEGARAIDHMEGGVSREKRTVDYSKQKIL